MVYLLTNFWTYAKHGHARDEILRVKEHLARTNNRNEIISVSPMFGENASFSLGNLAQNLKFDHTRLLKRWVDSRLIEDLEKNMLRSVAQKEREGVTTRIIFSSAKVAHVFQLNKIFNLDNHLYIRILDTPTNKDDWERLQIMVKRSRCKTRLAFEYRPTAEIASVYFDDVSHVPAAQCLGALSKDLKINRKRLGIFFPVGRRSDHNRIHFLLETLSSLEPFVKLPNHLDSKGLRRDYPQIKFIPHGVSDNELNGILNEIKVAVLGHEDYVNQSSAYASYFASNNVPVVVSEKNAFFSEFRNSNFYSLPTETHLLQNLVKQLMKKTVDYERSAYSEYAVESWNKFLELKS